MTPTDPVNSTYPNATVFVSLPSVYQTGCTPWQAAGLKPPHLTEYNTCWPSTPDVQAYMASS